MAPRSARLRLAVLQSEAEMRAARPTTFGPHPSARALLKRPPITTFPAIYASSVMPHTG